MSIVCEYYAKCADCDSEECRGPYEGGFDAVADLLATALDKGWTLGHDRCGETELVTLICPDCSAKRAGE